MSFPVLGFQSNQAAITRAFRIAMGDLSSNTLPHQAGLLSSAQPMIMAGLDYDSPWTRDSSINVWNAGSLIVPEIAQNTLQGVLEVFEGEPRIGGQYWDQIIWVTAAWHHWLVTGDRDFLVTAHLATENSLRYLEKEEFDSQKGLFRGGACFQDGVSGYPDRYARHGTSDIRHWVEAHPKERAPVGAGLPMMATSTNCLYYSAYHCAALMKEILGEPGAELCRTKGARLRAAIQQHLWNEAAGNFHYLIDPWETCSHQEGLGSAFAILLGLTEPAQTSRVLASQHITPHGIPCVWPSFDRYRSADGTSYGRHSGTIWPQVQGFWAEAAAQSGRPDLLLHELVNLSTKAVRDAQFTEIYHPDTGEIYGGRQEPFEGGPVKEWESCRRQTWSATAYLRMILHGVLGLKFTPEGLSFHPQNADPLTSLKLTGLPYRDSVLQIELEGTGSRLSEFRVNGQKRERAFIAATEKGSLDLFLRVSA